MQMATQTKRWTLDEIHSLPDDGNKYELVGGELFVTPPPSNEHETILAAITPLLDPFVAAHALGRVYHPRSVMRFAASEVEPDLMVRRVQAPGSRDWDDAPTPSLVVEVLSGPTRRRDHMQKRELYLAAGVGEYWIIDPDRRNVRVVRRGQPDQIVSEELRWQPAGATAPLVIRLAQIFDMNG